MKEFKRIKIQDLPDEQNHLFYLCVENILLAFRNLPKEINEVSPGIFANALGAVYSKYLGTLLKQNEMPPDIIRKSVEIVYRNAVIEYENSE